MYSWVFLIGLLLFGRNEAGNGQERPPVSSSQIDLLVGEPSGAWLRSQWYGHWWVRVGVMRYGIVLRHPVEEVLRGTYGDALRKIEDRYEGIKEVAVADVKCRGGCPITMGGVDVLYTRSLKHRPFQWEAGMGAVIMWVPVRIYEVEYGGSMLDRGRLGPRPVETRDATWRISGLYLHGRISYTRYWPRLFIDGGGAFPFLRGGAVVWHVPFLSVGLTFPL